MFWQLLCRFLSLDTQRSSPRADLPRAKAVHMTHQVQAVAGAMAVVATKAAAVVIAAAEAWEAKAMAEVAAQEAKAMAEAALVAMAVAAAAKADGIV